MITLKEFLVDSKDHLMMDGGHVFSFAESREVPLTDLERRLISLYFSFQNIVLTPQQLLDETIPLEGPWTDKSASLVLAGLETKILEKLGVVAQDDKIPGRIEIGDLVFDSDTLEVFSNGSNLPLTKGEVRVLKEIVFGFPRVVNSRALAHALNDHWVSEVEARDVAKVHVMRIRRKIEKANGQTTIVNRRGFGYQLRIDPREPVSLRPTA